MPLRLGIRHRIEIDSSHTAEGNNIVSCIEEMASHLSVALLPESSGNLTVTWADLTAEPIASSEVAEEKHYVVSVAAPNGQQRFSTVSVKALLHQADVVQSVVRDMVRRMEHYWQQVEFADSLN